MLLFGSCPAGDAKVQRVWADESTADRLSVIFENEVKVGAAFRLVRSKISIESKGIIREVYQALFSLLLDQNVDSATAVEHLISEPFLVPH